MAEPPSRLGSSANSTATRVRPGGDCALPPLTKHYHWLGDSHQVTSVLAWSQLLLLSLAFGLLVASASGVLADGILPSPPRPHLVWVSLLSDGRSMATVASCTAYAYAVSVLLSSWACRRRRREWTAAVLLLPWLLCMFSLTVPLMYWSIGVLRASSFYQLDHQLNSVPTPSDSSQVPIQLYSTSSSRGFAYYAGEFRFKWLPLIVLWILYFYVLGACSLAYVILARRGCVLPGGIHPRTPCDDAPASLSWTFRRTRLRHTLDRLHGIGEGDVSKTRSLGSGSWRSFKSSRHPTLRGFSKKGEDLEASLLSDDDSLFGGDSLQGHRRVSATEQLRATRGFAAYAGNGAVRLPLETVEEEERAESEGAAEKEDIRM